MYYLYGKINRGHGICPLYGGCPLLGESVIRGFTVLSSVPSTFINDLPSISHMQDDNKLETVFCSHLHPVPVLRCCS